MDRYLLLALYLFAGWLGAAVVNYLADVLPRRRKLAPPFCLNCMAEQEDLSFWLFPGRCSNCGTKRGWRVWLVFLAGLGVAVFLWINPDPRLHNWLSLLIWMYFGLVIVIDMEHRLILHLTSYFGALLGLFVGISLHGFIQTLAGGAVGFGFMWLMYWLGNVFFRTILRRRQANKASATTDDPLDRSSGSPESFEKDDQIEDALGFGDVNLAGIMGLFLGWPGVTAGLLLAILLGGAVSLLYLIVSIFMRRYRAFAAIPYGPFLAIAVLFLLYFS